MLIALCDDNREERDAYMGRMQRLARQIEIPVQFASYENGKQMLFELGLPESRPDIIYLDINMPDMSGMDVAAALRKQEFTGEIVFLTQSDNYWQPAFDVHAYHYIVKDDCSERKFSSIFYSVIQAVLARNEEYMVFNSCGETVSVQVKDIRYFESIRHIIILHYLDQTFEFYSTLSKLEEQLLRHGFLRVHKSYLVAVSQIQDMTYKNVLLRDGSALPLGRTYQKNLKEIFGSSGGEKDAAP